jgi:hypothetical protein
MKNNETLSRWTSDKEMDELIGASLQRQALLDDIQHEVMNEVRSYSRRETARRWARVAAFAFGMPAAALCFGVGVYLLCTYAGVNEPYMWLSVALSVITMLAFVGRKVRNFSLSDV